LKKRGKKGDVKRKRKRDRERKKKKERKTNGGFS
jgi:hypothetical protein